MQYSETILATLAQQVQDVFAERDALAAQVAEMSPQLAELQSQLENSSTYTAQVNAEREAAVNALNGQIDALNATITDLTAQLHALQTP